MSHPCRAAAPAASLAVMLIAANGALALERTSVRLDGVERPTDWNATNTTTLRYYNNCTGWVWVWSGWSTGERMGVCFDAGGPVYLNTTWALTFSGTPSAWGFTGTIAVHDGCDCSAPVLAAQAYLPEVTSGWHPTTWGGVAVPGEFFLSITWSAAAGFRNGTGLATDHPHTGPTGPQACGLCFPTTRTVHSRYFGVGGAYCPSGVTLNDGVCDVEFMIDANVKVLVALEGDSWGRVKSLYR